MTGLTDEERERYDNDPWLLFAKSSMSAFLVREAMGWEEDDDVWTSCVDGDEE